MYLLYFGPRLGFPTSSRMKMINTSIRFCIPLGALPDPCSLYLLATDNKSQTNIDEFINGQVGLIFFWYKHEKQTDKVDVADVIKLIYQKIQQVWKYCFYNYFRIMLKHLIRNNLLFRYKLECR